MRSVCTPEVLAESKKQWHGWRRLPPELSPAATLPGRGRLAPGRQLLRRPALWGHGRLSLRRVVSLSLVEVSVIDKCWIVIRGYVCPGCHDLVEVQQNVGHCSTPQCLRCGLAMVSLREFARGGRERRPRIMQEAPPRVR